MTTVREAGARWLEWRRAAGIRSYTTDAGRWRAYVEPAPWIDRDVVLVTRRDARLWLDELLLARSRSNHASGAGAPLKWQTVQNALNLARSFFAWALDHGHGEVNPFDGLKVPKSRRARTVDPWTVLSLAEEGEILAAMPLPERYLVAFAIGTGLRQGEQWALRQSDLVLSRHASSVHVAQSYHGQPTKSGTPRIVPLFGLGYFALTEWLTALPAYARRNPFELVFPTRRGSKRVRGHVPDSWREALRRRELGRSVRWHDLRHTCASRLVSGAWGRAWSLEEVRLLLGHSSIVLTERYAHFAKDVLLTAAFEHDRKAGVK